MGALQGFVGSPIQQRHRRRVVVSSDRVFVLEHCGVAICILCSSFMGSTIFLWEAPFSKCYFADLDQLRC